MPGRSAMQAGTAMTALNHLVRWLALGLMVTLAFANEPQPNKRTAAELMDAVMWNREPVGGPFRLTDHQGRMRRDTDFRGKVMLMYFGYTTCPDVCPTDLFQISQAMGLLGDSAHEVVPIFITLDPKRDTVKLLSAYVPSFHPQLIGLTGSEADISKVANMYRVFHQKVPVSGWLRYTIDHSAFIYVMGSDGRYLGFLPPGTDAQRIVDVVRPFLSVKNR
ncbi:SCO family protein [Limnohabitans sp.]|uniref:SCO family protein n=1 Tax=Limnohabitans sp. TaxID=1907725 RepID=UPI0038BBCBFE